jgi:hypothetical protein
MCFSAAAMYEPHLNTIEMASSHPSIFNELENLVDYGCKIKAYSVKLNVEESF